MRNCERLYTLQRNSRDRLGHRPGGDGFALNHGALLFRSRDQAACVSFFVSGQRKGSPVTSMRCRITASLRASATQAFLWPQRFLIRRAQSFSGWANDLHVVMDGCQGAKYGALCSVAGRLRRSWSVTTPSDLLERTGRQSAALGLRYANSFAISVNGKNKRRPPWVRGRN